MSSPSSLAGGEEESPLVEVRPTGVGSVGSSQADKTSLKRRLVAVQVKAAVLGRRLDSARDSELQEGLGQDLDEEWQRCFEAVSLLHADVLTWDDDMEVLEELACRVEDVLFEVKDRLSKRLRILDKHVGLPVVPVGSSENGIDLAGGINCDDLRVPVDGFHREGTGTHAVKIVDRPSTSNEMKQCSMEKGVTPGSTVSEGVSLRSGMTKAGLDPEATPFLSRPMESCASPMGGAQFLPPAPRLKLESYDGDVMKYWDFKRRFKRHIEDVYPSAQDRMAFLDSLCVGKAHEVIAGIGCLIDSGEAYAKSWDRLDKRFGDERKIMQHLREELLNGPVIKEGNSEALLQLADKMYQCEVTFDGLGKMGVLNSQELMHDLFCRLPHRVKVQFVSASSGDGVGSFSSLRALVERAAEEAESEYGKLLYKSKVSQVVHYSKPREPRGSKVCVAQSVARFSAQSPALKCECCGGPHKLWKCSEFSKRPLEDRRLLVRENGLCFNCLLSGHRVAQCRVKLNCRKCGKAHNTLLHWDEKGAEPVTGSYVVSTPPKKGQESDSDSLVCAAAGKVPLSSPVCGDGEAIFKVVPVKVWTCDPEKPILTYAFIDEGSSVNLCSNRLAERLGVPLTSTNVKLMTSNAVSIMDKKVNSLAIQGVSESESFVVRDAFVVDEVVDVSSSIPTDTLTHKYPHLRSLNFPLLTERKVELLLGCDLHQAYLIKEVLMGDPGSPCGLHTALGWTVYGRDAGDQSLTDSSKVMVNFINVLAADNSNDSGCERLLEVFAQDFKDCDDDPSRPSLSQDDKRALAILNSTAKRENGHYSVGLLWKDESPMISDGLLLAKNRLSGLKRRFKKNGDLFQKYSEKMSEYITKYAEQVPESLQSEAHCRYIPHHCTSEEVKFRVVFDCSARSGGESLNDKLLQGPDLTNSVVGVLIRFRQYPVAVVADIKGMFSQVLVEEADRDALRFLWFPDNNLDQPPATFRMRTHVFGAKSSPCCAAFALRMTASDNVVNANQDVVNAVMRNIYVDDACISCATEEAAVVLVTQLRQLLASGGFCLTKFVSNSRMVLEQIPSEDLAGAVGLAEQLPVYKTLGVYWDASSDRLKVRVRIQKKPCTRRGLLSIIGQTFDPLGVISPFLLPARRLLQQACVMNLGWDDCINNVPGLELDWERWLNSLPQLERVELARCILPVGRAKRIELHTFSDASTVGYGACAYLRTVYFDGAITCCLLMGKSRVCPAKVVSIPRLELTAAVLAAKLSNLIGRELELVINEAFYWTDATVVLRYLNNSSSRFETFVANRVELLHTLTPVSQWRYVGSKENPADIASRGLSPKECGSADLWFCGPSFLLCDRDKWPEQPSFLTELSDSDPEVKKRPKMCLAQKPQGDDGLMVLLSRYSDLTRLQRAVAWLLRFKDYVKWKFSKCTTRPSVGPLTAAERDAAHEAVLQVTQLQSFSGAFAILTEKAETAAGPVNPITDDMLKCSTLRELRSLNPFIACGKLRVGGRLRNASIPYEAKYPLLLPHQHPVTDLMIKFYHEKEGHLGANHVIAEMNKKYWIVKARSAVKRVLDKCVPCRFWKVGGGSQQMGDLPPARVDKNQAFNAIGTDLMGPLMISVGRSSVKRYVCIFSCMATRAVHFEVVPSLDVDSFLQAFRRFCNRRNVNPKTVYSDNGGNFVAAAKQLKDKLNWCFNPPRASHQGGFYEIFFKLFRKIFRSIVEGCTMNEFDLLTYVVEVERILNNRPITKLPNSPNDWAALTPNSILTGSLADDVPYGKFLKADAYRRSWKKTEYLADRFWKQWTSQYLPLLQPRQKWFAASANFEPGDLVLMMDESTPRGSWPKAIVVEKLPDKCGLVRRVRVRTADGSTFMRDIRKLGMLEGQLE